MAASGLTVEKSTYQGVHKESAGYRMLAAMGWQEGNGLGASGQGIKQHIKVKKKNDSLGVGLAEARLKAQNWMISMSGFDKMLSGLKEVTANTSTENATEKPTDGVSKKKDKSKKSKKKRKSSKSESSPTVKECKIAKKPKTDSGSEKLNGSSSNEEGSDSSEKDRKKKGVSHIGRFKRQEASKSVRNYSETDLAAILGAVGGGGGEEESSSPVDEAETECMEAENAGDASNPEPESLSKEDDAAQWWFRTFVRARSVKKAKNSKPAVFLSKPGEKKIKVHGFSEDDQTNLYNQVQQAASTGRKGLGDRIVKKIGGVDIGQGKRVTFGDDDDNDDNDGNCEKSENGNGSLGGEQDNGSFVICPPRSTVKKAKEDIGSCKEAASCENAEKQKKAGASINWKKLAVRELKLSGKSEMKVSKLGKMVIAKAGVLNKKGRKEAMANFKEAIEGSSKLVVGDKVVRLAK